MEEYGHSGSSATERESQGGDSSDEYEDNQDYGCEGAPGGSPTTSDTWGDDVDRDMPSRPGTTDVRATGAIVPYDRRPSGRPTSSGAEDAYRLRSRRPKKTWTKGLRRSSKADTGPPPTGGGTAGAISRRRAHARREQFHNDVIDNETRTQRVPIIVGDALAACCGSVSGVYEVLPTSGSSLMHRGSRNRPSTKGVKFTITAFLESGATADGGIGSYFYNWAHTQLHNACGERGCVDGRTRDDTECAPCAQAERETTKFEDSLLVAMSHCVSPQHEMFASIGLTRQRIARGDSRQPGVAFTGGDVYMALLVSVTNQFREDTQDLKDQMIAWPYELMANGLRLQTVIAKITTMRDTAKRLWTNLGSFDDRGVPVPPPVEKLWYLGQLLTACHLMRAHFQATIGVNNVGRADLVSMDKFIRQVTQGETSQATAQTDTSARRTGLNLTVNNILNDTGGPGSDAGSDRSGVYQHSPSRINMQERGVGRAGTRYDGGGDSEGKSDKGNASDRHDQWSGDAHMPRPRGGTSQSRDGATHFLMTGAGPKLRQVVRVGERVGISGAGTFQVLDIESPEGYNSMDSDHVQGGHVFHLCEVANESEHAGSPRPASSRSDPYSVTDRSVTDDVFLHGLLRCPPTVTQVRAEHVTPIVSGGGTTRQSMAAQHLDEERNLHAVLDDQELPHVYHAIAQRAFDRTRAERARTGEPDGVDYGMFAAGDSDTSEEDGSENRSTSIGARDSNDRGRPDHLNESTVQLDQSIADLFDRRHDSAAAKKRADKAGAAHDQATVRMREGQVKMEAIIQFLARTVTTAEQLLAAIGERAGHPSTTDGGFTTEGDITATYGEVMAHAQDKVQSLGAAGGTSASPVRQASPTNDGRTMGGDQLVQATKAQLVQAAKALDAIRYLSGSALAKRQAFTHWRMMRSQKYRDALLRATVSQWRSITPRSAPRGVHTTTGLCAWEYQAVCAHRPSTEDAGGGGDGGGAGGGGSTTGKEEPPTTGRGGLSMGVSTVRDHRTGGADTRGSWPQGHVFGETVSFSVHPLPRFDMEPHDTQEDLRCRVNVPVSGTLSDLRMAIAEKASVPADRIQLILPGDFPSGEAAEEWFQEDMGTAIGHPAWPGPEVDYKRIIGSLPPKTLTPQGGRAIVADRERFLGGDYHLHMVHTAFRTWYRATQAQTAWADLARQMEEPCNRSNLTAAQRPVPATDNAWSNRRTSESIRSMVARNIADPADHDGDHIAAGGDGSPRVQKVLRADDLAPDSTGRESGKVGESKEQVFDERESGCVRHTGMDLTRARKTWDEWARNGTSALFRLQSPFTRIRRHQGHEGEQGGDTPPMKPATSSLRRPLPNLLTAMDNQRAHMTVAQDAERRARSLHALAVDEVDETAHHAADAARSHEECRALERVADDKVSHLTARHRELTREDDVQRSTRSNQSRFSHSSPGKSRVHALPREHHSLRTQGGEHRGRRGQSRRDRPSKGIMRHHQGARNGGKEDERRVAIFQSMGETVTHGPGGALTVTLSSEYQGGGGVDQWGSEHSSQLLSDGSAGGGRDQWASPDTAATARGSRHTQSSGRPPPKRPPPGTASAYEAYQQRIAKLGDDARGVEVDSIKAARSDMYAPNAEKLMYSLLHDTVETIEQRVSSTKGNPDQWALIETAWGEAFQRGATTETSLRYGRDVGRRQPVGRPHERPRETDRNQQTRVFALCHVRGIISSHGDPASQLEMHRQHPKTRCQACFTCGATRTGAGESGNGWHDLAADCRYDPRKNTSTSLPADKKMCFCCLEIVDRSSPHQGRDCPNKASPKCANFQSNPDCGCTGEGHSAFECPARTNAKGERRSAHPTQPRGGGGGGTGGGDHKPNQRGGAGGRGGPGGSGAGGDPRREGDRSQGMSGRQDGNQKGGSRGKNHSSGTPSNDDKEERPHETNMAVINVRQKMANRRSLKGRSGGQNPGAHAQGERRGAPEAERTLRNQGGKGRGGRAGKGRGGKGRGGHGRGKAPRLSKQPPVVEAPPNRPRDDGASVTPPGGMVLGRSRNGPDNPQTDENQATRMLASVYKDQRVKNEGKCLKQIADVETTLKAAAEKKAKTEKNLPGEHETKGPDTDPPDDPSTSQARSSNVGTPTRVHFQDDQVDALEHDGPGGVERSEQEREARRALGSVEDKRTARGTGGQQDRTDDRDQPRYRRLAIYKDLHDNVQVRNIGAAHSPDVYEADLHTRPRGVRHTVGEDEAVDIFLGHKEAGEYGTSNAASMETKEEKFNSRHGRRKVAARRARRHRGGDGAELHETISKLRGSNTFSVEGTDESDATCLAAVRRNIPHRTATSRAEHDRQAQRLGRGTPKTAGQEPDEAIAAAAQARTLGHSDDLCRGLGPMGATERGGDATALRCILSLCPAIVRVRRAALDAVNPHYQVAEVEGNDGVVVSYNLDGGGETLLKLVKAGKIVLVVIDTAADRSHCDPNNPNLVETFMLKQAIVAIMANGTTTRLERGGILELHFLDAFGNAKRTTISVLLTPGMGDMILMSGTDVAKHLGQLRGPDGPGGRASICQLADHTREKDRIDDSAVIRRFPLCMAQGNTGGPVDRPAENGVSFLAMAMPREEGPRPRRKDLADLTGEYLHKFEGANDQASQVRATLSRSMGPVAAKEMVSEIEKIRALPLSGGGEKEELETERHVEGHAGLEGFRAFRLGQGYTVMNKNQEEIVVEIQSGKGDDQYASGDVVKVKSDLSVTPAHARGRVGVVAGYAYDVEQYRRVIMVDFGTNTSGHGRATYAGVKVGDVERVQSPISSLRTEVGATVRIHSISHDGRRSREPEFGEGEISAAAGRQGTILKMNRRRVVSESQMQVALDGGGEAWVAQSHCTVIRSANANHQGTTSARAVHAGASTRGGDAPDGGSTAGESKSPHPGADQADAPPPGQWVIGGDVEVEGERGTIDFVHQDQTKGMVATVSRDGRDPAMIPCGLLVKWSGKPNEADAGGIPYNWPPEVATIVIVNRSDGTRHFGAIVAAEGSEDSAQPSKYTVASVGLDDESVEPSALSPASDVDTNTIAALRQRLRQFDEGSEGEGQESKTAGAELSYGMARASSGGGTIRWPPPENAHVLFDGHPSVVHGTGQAKGGDTQYTITRVSDGRVTHDASLTRMTPSTPFDGSNTNGQSRATSLRRKTKGKRDTVARTGMGRWVNTMGLLLTVWHLILGHCHADRVKKTLDVGTIGGRIITPVPKPGDTIPHDQDCPGCMATQVRSPWAKQSTAVRAEDCFDMLTMDYPGVKGGQEGGLPVSLTGGHVPLFIVDHHSSYCWVFETRDYSGEAVCQVIEKMDTTARQSGRRVGTMGSDSARTFTHGRVPRLCAQMGIQQTFTHTNSSNGNPRCERMIRTIYRAARACLAHCQLPLTCWYQALRYNASVANVLCSKSSTVTPHELMFHTVPVMSEHWHVFGSRGAVTNVSKAMMTTSKLLPTATPGYFVGQCTQRRGVEMLYMHRSKKGKIIPIIAETRDYVIFNLTTARTKCPPDLVGLQGDPGEEASALKSLSFRLPRQEPNPETGRLRDIDLPTLPARFLGEPRSAQAEEFIGRTVTNRSPDGEGEINGVVSGTCFNQTGGELIAESSPPARIMYQVTWEGGAGEHVTWPVLHPLLSAGQLFDQQVEAGCGIDCPHRHPVVREPSRHDAYNCDSCGDPIRLHDDQVRCDPCDWDMCGTCLDDPRDNVAHHHNRADEAPDANDHDATPEVADADDDQEPFQTGAKVHILFCDQPATKPRWYPGTVNRQVATGYHCQYDAGEHEFIRSEDALSRMRYQPSPSRPGLTLERLNEIETELPAEPATRSHVSAINARAGINTPGKRGSPLRCDSARLRQGYLAHALNPGVNSRPTGVRLFAATTRDEPLRGRATEAKGGNAGGTDEEKQRKQAWGDARKRAKEAQAKVSGASDSFNLENGDAVIKACERRATDGKNTVVLIAQQDTEKQRRTKDSGIWGAMTEPALECWLPWVEAHRPEGLETGSSATVRDPGEPKLKGGAETIAILIGLSNGRRSLGKTRAHEWHRGLQNMLETKEEELRDAHVYVQVGTGMKTGGKVWMETFLPSLAEFAVEAGKRYGTTVSAVQHVPLEPTKWHDPSNWAGHAGIWARTRTALGMADEVDAEEETKPGAYAQGERRGAPDVERTLREMETTNVDMLTSTSGLACPSRLDGVYAATTGIDSEVEGKDEFYCDQGGEELRVGGAVKFATTAEEHHQYRAGGKVQATAPMLCSDAHAESNDRMDGGHVIRGKRRHKDVRGLRRRREERAAQRAAAKAANRLQGKGGTEKGTRKTVDVIKNSRLRMAALTARETTEMVLLSANDEEPTYRDALSGPVGAIWYDAVLAEMITQMNQSAFRVVARHTVDPGINIMLSGIRLNVKWTHTTALGHSPKRFKARYVCGGDSQEYLQTYVYVSSPCPRPATVRWLLAKSSDPGWEAYGVDVAGAFCQAPVELPGEMFMELPRWLAPDDRGGDTPDGLPWNQRQDTFDEKGEYRDWANYGKHIDPIAGARASHSNAQRRKGDRSDFVLELKRMIYGCKQSARVWHQLWCAFLQDHGFVRSAGDECMWSRVGESGDALIVCTHVDDTLCVTPNVAEFHAFLEEMKDVFDCTDEGGGKSIEFFLGVRIERDDEKQTVTLSQEALHDKILHTADESNLGGLASTPMLEGAHLHAGVERVDIDPRVPGGGLNMGWKYGDPLPERTEEETRAIRLVPYRRLVGQLIHCVTWTRPDIAYAVSSLARFADPLRTRWAHVKAMSRLVEYIRETKAMGITYQGLRPKEQANMVGFVDADWAGDTSDRLSMTGYVMMCRGGAISWQAAKQEIVAQSSFESELIATRAVAAEMIGLIKDFPTIERVEAPTPLVVGCDNAACCAVSTGGGSYKNRRHIDIRYLLIRETVMKGDLILEPIPTDWNPADLGTKSLNEVKHCRFRDYMMNNSDRKYEEGSEWMSTTVRPGGVPIRASRVGTRM